MKTALIFPGQGSQFVGMGKDLYENFKSAKEVFQKVDEVLKFKLSNIIFEGPSEELTQTQNTQPALMAVSIALIEILEKEFGKKVQDMCEFVAGHSLGEYSALCAAKSITLEETARLLQIRGSEMAKCGAKTEGAMAAIIGAEIQVVEEIAKEASKYGVCQVANDNSVGQVVLSGTKEAVEKALIIAKEKGVKRALMLPVSGAFHSELMKDAALAMKDSLANAKIQKPIVPLIANVVANKVVDENEIRNFLEKQITASVKWRETMLFFEKNGVNQVIEIGAGKVLTGLASRTCKDISTISIQNVEDLKKFIS